MKTYIMVDVETNGPIPGDYSMTSLGAVIVDSRLDKTFKVNIKPISKKFDLNRKQFIDKTDAVDAKRAMQKFKEWIIKNAPEKIVFISDNNGFDWMFVCWYFWHFLGENPMGYSSQNLQSLYRGMKLDLSANIDELRNRKILHDAEEDAKDNALIFLNLRKKLKD